MRQRPRSVWAVRRGMLVIALAATLWAVVEALGASLSDDHSAFQVVWTRYAVHLLVLLVIAGPRRAAALPVTPRLRLQVARGLLMVLMPACFLLGLALGDMEDVLAIFWITPLMTMALAVWLLHEHVEMWVWPAVLIGWGGAAMVDRPEGLPIGPATIPALGMAFCLSLYLVLTVRLRDDPVRTSLFYTAACVLLPLTLAIPFAWHTPTLRTLALMIVIGVLGLGLLYAMERALDEAPVSAIAPLWYVQPVAILFLTILTGEAVPGRSALLGTALIVLLSMALLVTAGSAGTGNLPVDAPGLDSVQQGGAPPGDEPATVQKMGTRS